MARLKEPPKSSLRNNVMIAFFLAIILLGVSITAMSHHILRRALLESNLPPESIQGIGQQVTQMLTGFTIAGTVVAILIAALLSRTITAPLQRLLAGVAKIGSGDFGAHIDVSGDDELGRLATAFNDMAQNLKQSHDHLESTVEERTAELTDTNQKLQTEIAERWRAEEAVRGSEQRLQDILNSILAGVFIVDPETHIILDINDSAARQVGLAKSEIVGKVCHQFVCPAECGRCPITDLEQVVDQSERVLLKADGTSLPIIKSVTRETFQGHTCLIESFVDIKSQKKAEDDLKESLSLLEATLEATVDAIYVTDTENGYKNFNSQFKDLWQLPDEVCDPGDRDRILATVLTQLKTSEPVHAEIMALRRQPKLQATGILELKNGTVVEYSTNPQCINDEIVGRVWSFRDITAKHDTQQKQERLLRQVADINEELSHFAYVVSHDLKAPLRGIKLLTEWLCTDYGDQLGDEAKENFDLLQSRVDRMHNLIEGVLRYSRVGRTEEEKTDIDLNELLPGIIDAIVPPEHVTITVEGPLPSIECEPTQITQIFQNLLSNAVKYMDKPVGQIVVAHEDAGDAWKFRVTDNGPGIEERYFDRIFKIFQTLTARDEFESTGVGLTLVKKIIELYGGKIWVESEVGKGSTFFFTFPKHAVETQNKSVQTDAASRDRHPQETVATFQR
jgi:two-component system, LuxR family, sensor kinase FixL